MRHSLRFLMAAVLLTLLGASMASAQRPQTRRGFWIGFGIGYGSADVSCDGCGNVDAEGGFSSFIKLGGTLNDKVLLGADITGWTKSEGGTTATLGNMTAAVFFYPMPQSGLFLKGGAGFSVYTESNGIEADGTGVGLTVGVGYDVRVGANISLTPVADFVWGSVGDIQADGVTAATGWKQNLLHLGLGVTFH
ncbi:MAG TPA: outer membrane beta-barrel protein [Gemmatimonadales bacterium]|nr:outer membrane beta-barrel protein [Gemmatimonadales bacterium]